MWEATLFTWEGQEEETTIKDVPLPDAPPPGTPPAGPPPDPPTVPEGTVLPGGRCTCDSDCGTWTSAYPAICFEGICALKTTYEEWSSRARCPDIDGFDGYLKTDGVTVDFNAGDLKARLLYSALDGRSTSQMPRRGEGPCLVACVENSAFECEGACGSHPYSNTYLCKPNAESRKSCRKSCSYRCTSGMP